jgi:hypothetical protein
MRMFMSVQIPNESGNAAIKSGALPRVMGKFMETFKPESAYFITKDGDRCGHFYVDLKDVTQMPSIAEPFFIELGAKVTYCPAMNAEDLKKGIEAYMAVAAR